MSTGFTLKKKERLKSRKALEQLFRSGKSFSIPPYRVIYQPTASGLQFGVGVSAKHFRKAVDRNRIKRQTREVYRLQKNGLQQWLLDQQKGLQLFITFTAREHQQTGTLSGVMEQVIKKLLRILHESNAPAA